MKGHVVAAILIFLCFASVIVQIVAIESMSVHAHVINAYPSDFVFFVPTKIIVDYEIVLENQVPIPITVDNVALVVYADGAFIGSSNIGPRTLNPSLNSLRGTLTLSVPQTLAYTMAGKKAYVEIRIEKTIKILWIIPIHKITKTYPA